MEDVETNLEKDRVTSYNHSSEEDYPVTQGDIGDLTESLRGWLDYWRSLRD